MTESKLDLSEMEKALASDSGQLWAKLDRQLPAFRQMLLRRLANRNLDSIPRTLDHFQPEQRKLYESAQNNLRTLWSPNTPFTKKQGIVDAWLDAATKRLGTRGLHAWLARERFEFDLDSFPGQFVTAILENWRYFRICANPNCPEPYFLAKRSTQRYCERGDCTKYAQQQHALKWWRENKSKSRRKHES